jgi:hypothetical protein
MRQYDTQRVLQLVLFWAFVAFVAWLAYRELVLGR